VTPSFGTEERNLGDTPNLSSVPLHRHGVAT